jgi:LysM repeat protein
MRSQRPTLTLAPVMRTALTRRRFCSAARSAACADQTTNTTTNSYIWWGGALQSKTAYAAGSTSNTSTFYYDDSGALTSVYIQDGRPRTVTFINDANGQILQRDENDNQAGGDPRELHYYFNGLRVGDISNNGTSDTDYATAIAQHIATGGTGAFRNGATTSTNYADFDQSYNPINGLSYEGAASRYTVQPGDTLETIAQTLWGDASFWYMIADANGLTGSETLVADQSLIIPNKVHNSHNNSDTYKVYDPNEAIGDTMPTAAKPPKKAKCGTFGQVLMVAIAVAVTVIALPGAGATISFGHGLLAGATGSAASQAVGLATGIQSKFDFKGFALSALAGGISAGIGPNGSLFGKSMGADGLFGKGFLAAAGRGVVSSAISKASASRPACKASSTGQASLPQASALAWATHWAGAAPGAAPPPAWQAASPQQQANR